MPLVDEFFDILGEHTNYLNVPERLVPVSIFAADSLACAVKEVTIRVHRQLD